MSKTDIYLRDTKETEEQDTTLVVDYLKSKGLGVIRGCTNTVDIKAHINYMNLMKFVVELDGCKIEDKPYYEKYKKNYSDSELSVTNKLMQRFNNRRT
jgi:NAD dependent epimerase/dehydratase family enzyme